MQEYLSDAVVLDAQPDGDLDSRISIFTRHFGKLRGKAKSIRKITSKLAGHLQAGNVVQVRLVEKNGLQIVDALKRLSTRISPSNLYFLDRLLPEGEPDEKLWHSLTERPFEWKTALQLLGWDPAHAQCAACGETNPRRFAVESQEFFCKQCASKLSHDAVIYIE